MRPASASFSRSAISSMMIVLPHRLELNGEADAAFAGKEQPCRRVARMERLRNPGSPLPYSASAPYGLQNRVADAGVMFLSFAALLNAKPGSAPRTGIVQCASS